MIFSLVPKSILTTKLNVSELRSCGEGYGMLQAGFKSILGGRWPYSHSEFQSA